MARYRKLPVEIDAVRWDGVNESEVQKLLPDANVRRQDFDHEGRPMLLIEGLEQNARVMVGDYVFRTGDGTIGIGDSETFLLIYEAADGE